MSTDSVHGVTTRDRLDLGTALRLSAVEGDPGPYESISVWKAPVWLMRVWGRTVEAMTLPHSVYVSENAIGRIEQGDAVTLLIHESAHVDQWQQFGRIGFLRRYLGDYLWGRAVGLPHHVAYRAIRFERMAVERAESR